MHIDAYFSKSMDRNRPIHTFRFLTCHSNTRTAPGVKGHENKTAYNKKVSKKMFSSDVNLLLTSSYGTRGVNPMYSKPYFILLLRGGKGFSSSRVHISNALVSSLVSKQGK